MKKYITITLSAIFLLILSSCCKNNDQEQFYIILNEYVNTNGELCLTYVNNDKTLIQRDKEKYISRHRTLKKLLNNIEK